MPYTRWVRHRWLLALGLLAPACLFPALDGLTGADGSAPDVSADVTTPPTDAGDAAVESGPLCPDASDASYCASLCPAPTFCDDFDKDKTFSRWSDGLVTSPGSYGNIQEGGVSPPQYAQLVTKLNDASTAFSELRTKLPSATVITVDGDANVTEPAAHWGLFSLELVPLPPYDKTLVFVDVSYGSWDIKQDIELSDGGVQTTTLPISAAVPTGWFHVTFTLDTVAHTMSLTVDGQPLAASIPASAALTPGNVTLRAGIYFVPANVGQQKVWLDNVVVRAQ